MARQAQLPKMWLHKATGQARVRLDGRDIYLGKHGTPEASAKFDAVVQEWLANGRRLPDAELTIGELVLGYLEHAATYYRKDGAPTKELDGMRQACKALLRLHIDHPAHAYGPRAFRATRQQLIDAGHARTYCNATMNRIRRVFRWAASQELVPPSLVEGLRAVEGLKAGRTMAPERPPVPPVEWCDVAATLPHLSSVVRAMALLQWHTGMRPGEVVQLRGRDIDRSGPVWTYRPARHKTQHHGKERQVSLGPRAQAIVRPFLTADPERHLFCPADARQEWLDGRATARATPRYASHTKRNATKRKPVGEHQRAPGSAYSTESYGRAIKKACSRAAQEAEREGRQPPAQWTPNQLRHAFATRARAAAGLDAARTALGHSRADTTEIYAERDHATAADLAYRIG